LEQIALEDHIWYLKSWDINGIRVVKIHCGECCKDLEVAWEVFRFGHFFVFKFGVCIDPNIAS
jgi:hypothetical protein